MFGPYTETHSPGRVVPVKQKKPAFTSIRTVDVGEEFPGQLAFNCKTPSLQSAVHQHLWSTDNLKGIISQFKKVKHERLIIYTAAARIYPSNITLFSV